MPTDLLTRLEQAAVGSRELTAEIAESAGWCFVKAHSLSEAKWLPPDWNDPAKDPDFPEPPAFSTSLDAKLPWENITYVKWFPNLKLWAAIHTADDGVTFDSLAKTEPLARRIAALRARG